MWLKVRHSLEDDPRLHRLADLLGDTLDRYALSDTASDLFSKHLATLTLAARRDLTLAAIQRVWKRIWKHVSSVSETFHPFHETPATVSGSLKLIDDYANLSGFGAAMVSVGWLHHDPQTQQLTLPDWWKYNLAKTGKRAATSAKSSTQRVREFRARQRSTRPATPQSPPSAQVKRIETPCNGNGNALKRPEEEKEETTTTTNEGGGGLSLGISLSHALSLTATIPGCTEDIVRTWHARRTRINWQYTASKSLHPITRANAAADLAEFTRQWHKREQAKPDRTPVIPKPRTPNPDPHDPNAEF